MQREALGTASSEWFRVQEAVQERWGSSCQTPPSGTWPASRPHHTSLFPSVETLLHPANSRRGRRNLCLREENRAGWGVGGVLEVVCDMCVVRMYGVDCVYMVWYVFVCLVMCVYIYVACVCLWVM